MAAVSRGETSEAQKHLLSSTWEIMAAGSRVTALEAVRRAPVLRTF